MQKFSVTKLKKISTPEDINLENFLGNISRVLQLAPTNL